MADTTEVSRPPPHHSNEVRFDPLLNGRQVSPNNLSDLVSALE
jgi:hypothetical protein